MTLPPADDREWGTSPRRADRPAGEMDEPGTVGRSGAMDPTALTGPAPTGTADAATMLALAQDQRARTERAVEPDLRVVYGVWGAAYVVGFLAFWTAATGRGPLSLTSAGAVLAVSLVLAVVISTTHIGRRVRGVRGTSSRTGAMYGWSWFLAFATLSAVMAGASRQGLPEETVALLWPVLSGLIVGTLYLAGGALWQDGVQFGLGAWVLVSSAAGALVGYPAVHLMMALGGGGGFLLAAALLPLAARRRL